MTLPSDIVLFLVSNLGKGGICKKPLIIRVSRKEVKRQRKNKSREEALLGECVVFGANSRHNSINFWENALYDNSCFKNLGKPPRKPLFLMISDKY